MLCAANSAGAAGGCVQMLFTRVLAKSNELRMLVLEEVGMDHRSCRIMANQLMCARAAAVCVCAKRQ